MGTTLEIVCFLTSYALIFFERITNKSIAKFHKISEEKKARYLKDNKFDIKAQNIKEPLLQGFEMKDFREDRKNFAINGSYSGTMVFDGPNQAENNQER